MTTLPTAFLLGALITLSGCLKEEMSIQILEATTTEAVQAGTDDPTVVFYGAPTTPSVGAHQPLVVVTIFEDFECPFCSRTRGLGERLAQTWPETVQVQHRMLPLFRPPNQRFPQGFHLRSRAAARAAMAAHLQHDFSAYRTRLFRLQSKWRVQRGEVVDPDHDLAFEEKLLEIAAELGLDTDKFAADSASDEVARKIEDDMRKSQAVGARGTPTIMVNGRRADVRKGFKDIARLVREELLASEKLLAERMQALPANPTREQLLAARGAVPFERARAAAEHPDYAALIVRDEAF